MKIAVVIPWRSTESRLPLKEYVVDWYTKNLPDFDLFFTDSGHKPFNLSASRNIGANLAKDYDVVIHNDADTIPELQSLLQGIDQVYETGYFCNPYSYYRLIGVNDTRRIAIKKNLELLDAEYVHIAGACSGIVITTPATLDKIGGFDEKFVEWGYEDVAIAVAHATIMDHGFIIIPGNAFALSHDITTREPDLLSYGAQRLEQYLAAIGNKELMEKLIGNNDE